MFSVKKIAKTIIYPIRYIKYTIKLAIAYFNDLSRYKKHTKIDVINSSQKRMRAAILMSCHGFEKGLSLPEPRVGFGQPNVSWLLSMTRQYTERFGHDSTSRLAIEILWAYYRWNRERGNDLIKLHQTILELFPEGQNLVELTAGVEEELNREDILKHAKLDLQSFFEARHSIRSFGPEPVEMEIIKKAVRMAQKTPSVCNRQPWRVYAFSGDAKNKVIMCQRGNKGFGHLADKVLVVTSELQSFFGVGERNEFGIDGGMFSMSIVYALHSLGVGTCCLAWAVESSEDLKLRNVAKIPDSEAIIMLIAVGHLPKRLRIARSTRMSLDQILNITQ